MKHRLSSAISSLNFLCTKRISPSSSSSSSLFNYLNYTQKRRLSQININNSFLSRNFSSVLVHKTQPSKNSYSFFYKPKSQLCFYSETTASFCSLINNTKDVETAHKTYCELKKKNTNFNASTFKSLFSTICTTRSTKYINEYLRDMKDAKVELTSELMSILYNIYNNANDLQSFLNIYEENQDIQFSYHIYSKVVRSYIQLNRSDELDRFIELMVSKSTIFDQSFQSMNLIIHCVNYYASKYDFNKLFEYYELAKKITKNKVAAYRSSVTIISNILIKICCEHDMIDDGLRVLNEMIFRRERCAHYTFLPIFRYYFKIADFTNVTKLRNRMISLKVDVNAQFFNSLINYCTINGGVRMADSYFEEMQNLGIQPDSCTFNTLIKVATKFNDEDKIAHYFQQMENGVFRQ